MPSRRSRKRDRRLAVNGGLRGDREGPPPTQSFSCAGGVGGKLRGDWETASRGDLLLLRKAIREGWPVPPERRVRLLEAAVAPIYREDAPRRLVLAIARLALAAHRHNLDLLERALQDLRRSTPAASARNAGQGNVGGQQGNLNSIGTG
jgi:hypothetical protein